jgi:hypothetical protein
LMELLSSSKDSDNRSTLSLFRLRKVGCRHGVTGNA